MEWNGMEWNGMESSATREEPNNKKVLDEYTHYIPFLLFSYASTHIYILLISLSSRSVVVASIVVVSESHRILNESGIVAARYPI